VVAWFKQQAGGRGHQTPINAALREPMAQETIEETLRRLIREELHSACKLGLVGRSRSIG
jgi:hypothetical protein